jgi:Ser/Thr protein kinase RdoA (MazF antagonist)
MPEPLAPSDAARRLAPRFGFDPDRLEPLGAFESEVLAVDGATGPAILKVMDPSHRTPAEAQAEVDWLLALHEADVRVARPLAARDGAWLALDGDPPTVAVAYARAPGRHLAPDAWTPALFRAHGELVGRLQAHARGWTPTGPRRAGWRDHHALERAPEALPNDAAFLEAVAEVAARVDAHVPQGREDVGLVHADLHAWNVLVDDDGALTAIDFDDAVVGPYLYDLVIPLYYAVATRLDQEPGEVADAFLTPYLEGFDAVAPRPAGGADAVAAILAMRQADLAIFVRLDVPEERWDDDLRAAAVRLRDRTAARHEVVPRDVLRHHFGG